MNQEIKELGLLALRNAFHESFSELVLHTLSAGRGLGDTDSQCAQLQDLTSVYGVDPSVARAVSMFHPCINTFDARDSYLGRRGTMWGALSDDQAHMIQVNGKVVFLRKEGGWKWQG